MTEDTESPRAGIDFDPVKLVTEVNRSFDGFNFTIQAVRPPEDYAGDVKKWFTDKEEADKRGLSFDDPPPSIGTLGSATFVHCDGENGDSGFVLRLSMQAESGRPFVIFIEESDMQPEMGVWDRPDVETSIADNLAFWTMERICHSVVEDLDGREIRSGKWMKTWT
jgi:hypothetical protein